MTPDALVAAQGERFCARIYPRVVYIRRWPKMVGQINVSYLRVFVNFGSFALFGVTKFLRSNWFGV